MTGKLTPSVLAELVFARAGAASDDVLLGAAFGEDAAAVRVGDRTVVVSTDPVSLAAERIGQIGVAVASNDVAATGATPEYLLDTVLLPTDDPELLDTITAQVDAAARRHDIAIVGGHTEVVAGLDRPLLSLTCFGEAERVVPTSGARPGDRILLTKAAGIEATGVLATDFAADLDLPTEILDRARACFDDLSVIPEAAVLAPSATAMHDPTEGGVLEGLFELASVSGVSLVVDRDAVPVREVTRAICAAAEVDPLRVLGSGALLATVPESEVDASLRRLANASVEAAEIGRVEAGDPAVHMGGERYDSPVGDDMYELWE